MKYIVVILLLFISCKKAETANEINKTNKFETIPQITYLNNLCLNNEYNYRIQKWDYEEIITKIYFKDFLKAFNENDKEYIKRFLQNNNILNLVNLGSQCYKEIKRILNKDILDVLYIYELSEYDKIINNISLLCLDKYLSDFSNDMKDFNDCYNTQANNEEFIKVRHTEEDIVKKFRKEEDYNEWKKKCVRKIDNFKIIYSKLGCVNYIFDYLMENKIPDYVDEIFLKKLFEYVKVPNSVHNDDYWFARGVLEKSVNYKNKKMFDLIQKVFPYPNNVIYKNRLEKYKDVKFDK